MRNVHGRQRVGVVIVVIALCGSMASTVAAYTTATRTQRAAIRRVVYARWRSLVPSDCPSQVGGPKVFTMFSARVSSLDLRYAFASVRDDGCTFTIGYFVRRPTTGSNRWRVVVGEADSAQDCSEYRQVPGPVLREFAIEGVKNGQYQLCGSATGRPWCDQFAVAYAVNTTCAVGLKVDRLYGAKCIPASYRSGPLPPCRKRLDGFRCVPTGDTYAVVNCVEVGGAWACTSRSEETGQRAHQRLDATRSR